MIAPEQSWGWAERLWGGSLGRHCLLSCCLFAAVVSGVLWWLYYDYRNDPSTELETEKENVKFLFGYAIFSTTVTVSSILQQAVIGLWLENLNCDGFATIRIIPYFFQIWKTESMTAYSLLYSFVSSLWSSLVSSRLCHISALYKQYYHQFCRNAVLFHTCCPVYQLAGELWVSREALAPSEHNLYIQPTLTVQERSGFVTPWKGQAEHRQQCLCLMLQGEILLFSYYPCFLTENLTLSCNFWRVSHCDAV